MRISMKSSEQLFVPTNCGAKVRAEYARVRLISHAESYRCSQNFGEIFALFVKLCSVSGVIS
jgi:hypothetical protein